MPQALLVGRLVEVWADDGENPLSAMAPFTRCRRWWAERVGIGSPRELQELVPMGAPWSLERLTDENGKLAQHARQRLRSAGVTKRDIPRLRREAAALRAKSTPKR